MAFAALLLSGAVVGLLCLIAIAPWSAARKLALLREVCRTAVMAIEKTHAGMTGADKKRLARELVNDFFSHLGVHAPDHLVDALIEASVLLLEQLRSGSAQ